MAGTFNGIGTTFYGKKDIDHDGSFVTTKWFVIGFFPLVPLGSYRFLDAGTSGIPFLSRSTQYEVLEELPLNLVQVLCVYLYSIFIVFFVGGMLIKDTSPVAKIVTILVAIAIPFVARMLFGRKT